MKKKGDFSSSLLNRFAYSIITFLMVLLIGVSVYAFGTQNPGTFGHSAKELDLSSGIEGNAVFNGNVQATGTIQSTAGGFKFPDGTTQTTAGGGAVSYPGYYTGNLYNNAHTDANCISAGGTVEEYQQKLFCRVQGGSCPSGWTTYNNLGSTSSNTCITLTYSDNPANPQINGVSYCNTGSHEFTNKTRETCNYGGGIVCSAGIIEVGCY